MLESSDNFCLSEYPHMDLRSLECALALAEKQHFGRAASYLNITQPAFSQRIAALEDEIGHQLFIRDKSPVILTAAGEALIRRAKTVLENTRAAKDEARLAAMGLSGKLRIGFTPVSLYQSLPEVISRFHQHFPYVHIELKEQISLHQEQQLVESEIDIGVVHPPIANKELALHYLEESQLLLAVPSHWPQAKHSSASLRDFSESPFILPPRYIGPTFYDGLIKACNNAGFSPNVIQEAMPMSTTIGLVSTGIGAGFVTENFSVIQRPGVSFISLKEPLPILKTALSWKKNINHSIINNFLKTVADIQQSQHTKSYKTEASLE